MAVEAAVVVVARVIPAKFPLRRRGISGGLRRQEAKLARGVGEEANLALAIAAVLTGLGAVPGRVEPALKHPVGELAVVAAAAHAAAPELGAHGAGVVVPPGVPPAGLLAGVGERAVGPVVAAAAGAPADLELVHPEVVRRVGVVGVGVGVVAGVVVREVFLHEGLLS